MNKIKEIDLINNEGPNLSPQRDPAGKLVIMPDPNFSNNLNSQNKYEESVPDFELELEVYDLTDTDDNFITHED